MKKKILFLLLSLAIIISAGTPAVASVAVPSPVSSSAGSDAAVDEQLARVTLLVKETLGIGNEYTEFSGGLDDRVIRKIWRLNWANEDESLTVYADDNGKIYYYYRSQYVYDYRYDYAFAPKFPTVSREQAKAVAEEFLARVLDSHEGFDFDDTPEILNPTEVETYYFSGVLKLNGLDSPIHVTISVSTDDMKVRHFIRRDEDSMFIGDLPTPDPVTTKEKAAELLAGTVRMEIRYMLTDDSDEKNPTAKLQYIPVIDGNYVVNAKTGELIDINKIYEEINEGFRGINDAAEEEDAGAGAQKLELTPAELEGIAKLEGILTREQLDETARAISEIGITDDYAFNSISYSVDNVSGDVTAHITYSLRIDPDNAGEGDVTEATLQEAATGRYVTFITKSLSLDARTGALKSLYTSYPYDERYEALEPDMESLRAKAEEFLGKYFAENFEKSSIYNNSDDVIPYGYYRRYSPSVSFNYSQVENGYYFLRNNLSVSVNIETGHIDGFSMNWIDNVTFESPDGIISNEEACEKYAAAHETKLSYLMFPVAIDPSRPDHIIYAEIGYTYLYELILGYSHYTDKYITGIDAKTGDPVTIEPSSVWGIPEYKDITGHYAEAKIRKLAQYGIGFPGGNFKPDASLTQLDMLLLLLSADGYRFDHENLTEDEINRVYSEAYYHNILKKEDRDPTRIMTRCDVIRTILTMSGYDKTANLKGIYICSFNDASGIKEDDYGYFAIAQGLGVVNGDDKGNVKPYADITRVEAALMLYNFMSR